MNTFDLSAQIRFVDMFVASVQHMYNKNVSMHRVHAHQHTHTHTPSFSESYVHKHTRSRTHTYVTTHAHTLSLAHTHAHAHKHPYICIRMYDSPAFAKIPTSSAQSLLGVFSGSLSGANGHNTCVQQVPSTHMQIQIKTNRQLHEIKPKLLCFSTAIGFSNCMQQV